MFGSDPDHETIEVLGDLDLTAQTAIGLHKKRLIEHIQLSVRLFVQVMVALQIDLTGGTKGHPAAGTFYPEVIHTAYLHHIEIHVGRCLYDMWLTRPVDHCYSYGVFHGGEDKLISDYLHLKWLKLRPSCRIHLRQQYPAYRYEMCEEYDRHDETRQPTEWEI